MSRVALATSTLFPQLHDDDRLLVPLLHARGIEALPRVWTDAGAADAPVDLVVVRSTWDYVPQRERFLAWADAQPRICNPAAILRWNTDKRYLGALAGAGAPVVPTRFIAPGESYEPPAIEHVVKPTVSAGTRDTARFAAAAATASCAHVEALHAAGRTAMVQPYIASVDARGETALIYLGGELSHAIHKPALLPRDAGAIGSAEVIDLMRTRVATADEKAVAERILDAVPGGRGALLYARVDLVLGDDGPLLLELEATEPFLFLGYADGAAARFADVIAAHIGS